MDNEKTMTQDDDTEDPVAPLEGQDVDDGTAEEDTDEVVAVVSSDLIDPAEADDDEPEEES